MIRVSVLNESTVVSDADVQRCVDALQIQVTRDFLPIWGIPAQLNFHPSKIAAPGAWQLVILDDSDQADALGYHETTSEYLPLGKVFAKSDQLAGTLWTVTASHELLEMLVDPYINSTAEVDHADGSITLYAYEVADAVEADSLSYAIGAVVVSDFVTPVWFSPVPIAGKPVDFKGHISNAFQLAPGGYISVLQVAAGAQWMQITADGRPGGPVALPGSRRWRRRLPDRYWHRSRTRPKEIRPGFYLDSARTVHSYTSPRFRGRFGG
jgi:hypothetical protein